MDFTKKIMLEIVIIRSGYPQRRSEIHSLSYTVLLTKKWLNLAVERKKWHTKEAKDQLSNLIVTKIVGSPSKL